MSGLVSELLLAAIDPERPVRDGTANGCCSAKAAGQADISLCQVFGPKQSKRRLMPTITERQQAAKPAVDARVHCEVGRQ